MTNEYGNDVHAWSALEWAIRNVFYIEEFDYDDRLP